MPTSKSGVIKKGTRYFKKVQKEIQFCDTCQPYDGGSSFWLMGKPIEMDDLFYKLNIPNEYWEDIIGNLVCPDCGNEEFGLASTVGIKHDYEIAFEKLLTDSIRKHKNDIVSFRKTLVSTPFLGLQHSIANTILDQLRSHPMPTVSISGDFYRALKIDVKTRYTKRRMLPKKYFSSEGRFNHSGQYHLYMSRKEMTAFHEATYHADIKDQAYVQKLTITNPITNVLDLSYDYDNVNTDVPTLFVALFYTESLVRRKANKVAWKPDYLIPRFIMDCAKNAGYNGIKYNSARTHDGRNIVLFNNLKEVKPVGSPYLKELEEYTSSIIDF